MAKEKKKRKKAESQDPELEKKLEPIDVSKDTIEGFRGGLGIDLEKLDSKGQKLRERLTLHIGEVLDQELQNHSKIIQNLEKWQKQYQGKKEPKGFPYPGAANVASPITRSNVDTIHVRVTDALFNKRKVYICRARTPEFVGIDHEIEEFLDWYVRNILRLKEKSSDSLMQATKMGSGWGKLSWEQKTRTVYRYATEEEKLDPTQKKYKLDKTGDQAVKDIETIFTGPDFFPISREDIVFSSDSRNLEEAYIVGFRKYLREPQLQLKVKQGLYDKDAVVQISAPDKIDEVKENRADNQGLEIKKVRYEEPYEVWELWLKYDVDDDGEEDDIVITYHRQSKQILRAIYNPFFYGFRPFVVFKGLPIEFSLEGEGLCSVIENLQAEIDSIRNQRLDRVTQVNAPMYLVRGGSGLDNFRLQPGKIWFTDEELNEAVKELRFSEVYHSCFEEEDRLISQADRACGIYPESMGVSTSERPVAKESLARIEEANKKFKAIIENYRQGFIDLGYMIVEMFAQYQPSYEYRPQGGAELVPKTINFPLQAIRDGLEIELFASTELISQEVRREISMTVYGLARDFKTNAASVVQMLVNPMVPSYFKMWAVAEYQASLKLVRRIFEDFDIRDAEELLVDLEKIPGLEMAIKNSIDLQPPPPQGGEGGMPPEGEGGPPMAPQPPPQMGPM